MYVTTKPYASTQSGSKSQTPVAYQKKAQEFVTKAAATLNEIADKTATPAQQSQTLTQTQKVLTEAKAIVQQNPDTETKVVQEQAIDAISKETQVVKTSINQAVVIRGRSEDPEKALRPLKSELLQKMVTGLASDMPQVRQNARDALSKLGMTAKEMDYLHLVLEHQKEAKQKKRCNLRGVFL